MKIRFALIAAVLVAAGCAASPEGQLVGVWSIDLKASTLPKPPIKIGEDRIQAAVANFHVKLLSDHKLVVTGIRPSEGTWSYANGELRWEIDEGPFGDLVQDTKVTLTPDLEHIDITGTTFLGPLKLRLHKTG